MNFESALESNCQRGIATCLCLAQPEAQASEAAHVALSLSAVKRQSQ